MSAILATSERVAAFLRRFISRASNLEAICLTTRLTRTVGMEAGLLVRYLVVVTVRQRVEASFAKQGNARVSTKRQAI